MGNKALGFVFGDLHYMFWPREEQECIIDKELYIDSGFDLKFCVTASRLEVLLGPCFETLALKAFGSFS
jgi:hypothetical protein